MGVALAHGVLWTLGVYVATGILLGVPFVAFGIGRIDPAARTAPRTFRLLVLPGVIALWPLLMLRWVGSGEHR